MKNIKSITGGGTRFAFAMATKLDESNSHELAIMRLLDRICCKGVSVDVFVEFNNNKGLSTVYNRFLDDNVGQYDYIIFVHDDVAIHDAFLFDKIMESKFDVIGLCGGLKWTPPISESQRNIWTVACDGQASGFVIHNPRPDIFFASSYGTSPQRTLTLDGQFLCLTKKAVQKGLRFDEQFQFHFYDMDLTIQANMMGLLVGTSPILATHKSLGGSVMDDEFLVSQRNFIHKWFKQHGQD